MDNEVGEILSRLHGVGRGRGGPGRLMAPALGRLAERPFRPYVHASSTTPTPPVDTPRQGIPAALAERYQLGREIGAGGMGVVYVAQDLRHGRPVAVKLVRPDVLSASVAERFQREIAMAANLNHPHIVALYDSGIEGSALFFVMPLIEGETLRARLEREKQLPIAEVRRLAEHLASALEYAHGRGVVHRDVKPENIMLTSAGALLADFGIARGPHGGDRLTTTGAFIGSPRYSSPEQLKEESAVGPASDQYALACLLFEALAGHPPFDATNYADLVVAHVTEESPKVRVDRPDVPPAMERALRRAMSKDPADRFPDVAAFAAAFTEDVPAVPAATRASPFVFPLLAAAVLLAAVAGYALVKSGMFDDRNMKAAAVMVCEDRSQPAAPAYLPQGVTEQIIASLSTVDSLSVINMHSVRRFGSSRTAGEIGAELDAGWIVFCSINVQPEMITVSAVLADSRSEKTAWSGIFTERLVSAGAVGPLDQIAASIADSVLQGIDKSLRPRAREPQIVSDSAFRLWQRGRFEWHKGSLEGLKSSVLQFEAALRVEPEYADALVGLADAHLSLVGRWMQRPHDNYALADLYVGRALIAQPSLGGALAARGRLRHRRDWDWEGARLDLRGAIRDNGSEWQPYLDRAKLLSDSGRHESAIDFARNGLDRDPMNALNVLGLAEILYFAREYDEALAQADRAIELEPDFSFNHLWRAMILLGMGRAEDASAAAWHANTLAGGHPGTLAIFARAEAEAGRPDAARRVLADLQRSTQYLPGTLKAVVHMGLGEFDQAFEALERAIADRDWYIAELAVHPLADPVRNDPRLRPLLARLGLENVPPPLVRTMPRRN